MDDLISRQAAIDAMCCACGYDCDKSKFVYNAPQDEQVIMCPEHYSLSTLPSVQPRKGKWTYADGTPVGPWAGYGVYCSACKEKSEYATNYCGMCGADMRGDSE